MRTARNIPWMVGGVAVTVSQVGDDGLDVFLAGLLFVDIVMSGLDHPPRPGVEVRTKSLGTSPGGIANIAVSCSRLGLRTGLATVCGDDVLGQYCWDTLAQGEGVDLTWSRRITGWQTPVTVALAYAGDRALVTYGDEPPLAQDTLVGQPPRSAAAFVHLGEERSAWLTLAQQNGTLVFADVGWDPTQRWSTDLLDQLERCHAFVPNETEALAYARVDSAEAALSALGERVPLAVITRGAAGAIGVDASTGESASVPGLLVEAVDTTGAGDAFGAGLIVGTLAGWSLENRLQFATLVAALSVTSIGGASAAPTWTDISAWWAVVRSRPDQRDLARAYHFLDDITAPEEQATGGQPRLTHS